MALRARRGTALLTCFFSLFVTLGAQLVHNIFLFYFSLGLEFFDASLFLREHGMTYGAVTKILLVLMMGKRDPASCTAVYLKTRSAFILVVAGKSGR